MSLQSLIKKMNRIAKTDEVERLVATNMAAVTADRIFTQGKDATNNEIGEYSDGYMKQRQRMNYPNSRKVILQATRQMVNDWGVIAEGGSLGLGFKNSANADKSDWVESTYKKDIFKHTEAEKKMIDKLVAKKVKEIFNG